MMIFLSNNYDWLDREERASVVNDTFLVLVNTLPTYNYPENQQGLFRRYLISVMRNIARGFGRGKQKKRQVQIQYSDNDGMLDRLREENSELLFSARDEEDMARQDAIDLAIQGLLDDPSFKPTTREVFRRLVVEHEDPKKIAEDLRLERYVVDNMKSRVMKKFKRCANAMLQHINEKGE